MKTVPVSRFKAQCLVLLDEVARTGKPILITRHGRPLAELGPHRRPHAKSLFGRDKGRLKIKGDIISPIGTELWEALK